MKRPKHKSHKIIQRAAANVLAVRHYNELLAVEKIVNTHSTKLFSSIFPSLDIPNHYLLSFTAPPTRLSLQRNPRHPKCFF